MNKGYVIFNKSTTKYPYCGKTGTWTKTIRTFYKQKRYAESRLRKEQRWRNNLNNCVILEFDYKFENIQER